MSLFILILYKVFMLRYLTNGYLSFIIDRVPVGKTKIMVGGLDLNLLKRSGKVPCGICHKGVGSNAILSCGGCLRWIHKKCSDIKGPYPYFRCA